MKYLAFGLLIILLLSGCTTEAEKCTNKGGKPETTGETRLIPISHCAYDSQGHCSIYFTYITQIQFQCVMENGTIAWK